MTDWHPHTRKVVLRTLQTLSLSFFSISLFFSLFLWYGIHILTRSRSGPRTQQSVEHGKDNQRKTKKLGPAAHRVDGCTFLRIYTISYSLYKSVFSGACLVSMDEREGGIDRSPTRVHSERNTHGERKIQAQNQWLFFPLRCPVCLFFILFFFYCPSKDIWPGQTNKQTKQAK